MDVNEATVTKLQLTFREERGLAILSFGLEMDKISHVLCEGALLYLDKARFGTLKMQCGP